VSEIGPLNTGYIAFENGVAGFAGSGLAGGAIGVSSTFPLNVPEMMSRHRLSAPIGQTRAEWVSLDGPQDDQQVVVLLDRDGLAGWKRCREPLFCFLGRLRGRSVISSL